MKKINIAGNKYGRLLVLSEDINRSKSGELKWLCICDCGSYTTVIGYKLRNNLTRSCGCLEKDLKVSTNTTHGMTYSSEYISWTKMKARCLNKNDTGYADYGGRGILICQEWVASFSKFLEDMGPKPTKKHTLERKNVNGNYEPSNCKWATGVEQARNKRSNHWIEYNGKRMILSEWANFFGVCASTLRGHLKTKSINQIYLFYSKKS